MEVKMEIRERQAEVAGRVYEAIGGFVDAHEGILTQREKDVLDRIADVAAAFKAYVEARLDRDAPSQEAWFTVKGLFEEISRLEWVLRGGDPVAPAIPDPAAERLLDELEAIQKDATVRDGTHLIEVALKVTVAVRRYEAVQRGWETLRLALWEAALAEIDRLLGELIDDVTGVNPS